MATKAGDAGSKRYQVAGSRACKGWHGLEIG